VDQHRETIESEPFSCDQLRDRHSDFIDGLLRPEEMAELQAHIDECDACARYDRVLRNGLSLVRDLSEVRPSDDFEHRLQHRLFHLQDDEMLHGRGPFASFTSAAAIAAILGVVTWTAVLVRERALMPDAIADFQVESTMMVPLPALDPLGGHLADWYTAHSATLLTHSTSVRPTIFPGPYSPLIVRPPVHGGAVRFVSSEYRATE
jgi:hypothetical protein